MKNEYVSNGIICLEDKNIEYYLCKIEYHLNKDDSFKYVFTPNYDVIDLLPLSIFDSIPGLDLSLRKKTYIRENRVPVFISERVPNENRVDYYELLEKRNMEYMDPIVYLIRSKKYYSGDRLYVKEYEECSTVEINISVPKRNSKNIIKDILSEIAKGNDVIIDDVLFTGSKKKDFFKVLHSLYLKQNKEIKDKQKIGIDRRKKEGLYKGRKPKIVESIKLKEVYDKVQKKKIRPKEAAALLNISIDKYYRELKKLQN